MKVNLIYFRGELGRAIYLCDDDENGYRLVGSKRYGRLEIVDCFEMDEQDLEGLITEAKSILKKLKNAKPPKPIVPKPGAKL